MRWGAPTWTFYLESGISRYLPVLGRFNALRFRDAQNYRFSADLGILALRDEPATMTAYRVEDMAADSSTMPDIAYAGRWKKRDSPRGMPLQWELDLPHKGDREELARLAAQVGPLGTDFGDYARRASLWLRRQHGYTLAPKIPAGSGDPLVRWMSSREPGHCELFAGALVLLARSEGIPARVVTGFKGGTWNAYSGNYTIRNSDAHAWAEVWDPQRGAWLREDPLAAAAADDTARKGSRRNRRAHGPQLVCAAEEPSGLLVPADRELRPADADRHGPRREERDGHLGQVAADLDHRAGAPDQGVVRRALGRAEDRAASWRRPRSRARSRGSSRSGAGASPGSGGAARSTPCGARPGAGSSGSRVPTALVADLQRLRYGAAATWPQARGGVPPGEAGRS